MGHRFTYKSQKYKLGRMIHSGPWVGQSFLGTHTHTENIRNRRKLIN